MKAPLRTRRHTTAWWSAAAEHPALTQALHRADAPGELVTWPLTQGGTPIPIADAHGCRAIRTAEHTTTAVLQTETDEALERLADALRPLSEAHGGPYLPHRLAILVPLTLGLSTRLALLDVMRDAWNPDGVFTGLVDRHDVPLRSGDPILRDSTGLHLARVATPTLYRTGASVVRVFGSSARLTADPATHRCLDVTAAYIVTPTSAPIAKPGSVAVEVPRWPWLRVICR